MFFPNCTRNHTITYTNIPWENILSSQQSSDDKLTLFTKIIHYGLNTIMSERSVKVHENDRPWMNSTLKRPLYKDKKLLPRETNLYLNWYVI